MKQATWRGILLGLGTMLFLAPGCAHVDRARANYHEDRAERAAEHGRYRKAAREERKANQAEWDAEHDPLP